jgi:integrase
MGRLALRRDELRRLQIGDIDLANGLLHVHGKGGKRAQVPIVYENVADALYLHIVGEERHAAEYLLYPKKERDRMMSSASVHNWWSRCLERAGVSHFPMHELRHSAIDEIRRQTATSWPQCNFVRHEKVTW